MPLPLLAVCAIGAGVGALVSGGLYLATHHDAKTFSWGGLGASVAGGVVAGATAPVIGTEAAVGWLATNVLARAALALGTSAALGGGVTKVLDNLRTGVKWTTGLLSTVATNFVLGAALSFVGGNLFANASKETIEGLVTKGGEELEAKAPDLIKAGAAVVVAQIDKDVPQALQGVVNNAIDAAGNKAAGVVNQVVDGLEPKADQAILDAQAALRAKLGMPDATAPATAPGANAASAAGSDAAGTAAKTVASMITPKQVVFVGTLEKSLQVSPDAMTALMKDAAAKVGGPVAASTENLTQAQARYVIDQLLAKETAAHSVRAAAHTGTALTLAKTVEGELGGNDSNGSSSTTTAAAAPATTASGAPGDIVVHRQPGTTVTVTVSDSPSGTTGMANAVGGKTN
ncbi:MAG TPA: hypothetical protein VFF73_34465 [Planctomycetota bacterium]|nr:hypothetical protein [Planctomycetota bacterium]